MSARGFDSPEEAAGGDIPRPYVHVLAVEVRGDQAVVGMPRRGSRAENGTFRSGTAICSRSSGTSLPTTRTN
jgi:hypothetical protein